MLRFSPKLSIVAADGPKPSFVSPFYHIVQCKANAGPPKRSNLSPSQRRRLRPSRSPNCRSTSRASVGATAMRGIASWREDDRPTIARVNRRGVGPRRDVGLSAVARVWRCWSVSCSGFAEPTGVETGKERWVDGGGSYGGVVGRALVG